jgi:N4-gp56 family major capsid protein
MFLRRPRAWFRLARHDVRSSLPAAIQAIMQNGLLQRAFEEALLPPFLFPAIASNRPWAGNLGDTGTFTRAGLLAPVVTPLTVGNDPAAATYTIEQYSATMNQFGNSVDTNLLQSAMSLASKFIEDNQQLAVNAGQSLNRIARNKLYAGYSAGLTWVPAGGGTSVTWVVNDATGFDTVLVNGVKTAVSAGNPLAVLINGVANTVTGCVLGTNTLTLGTSVAITTGWTVQAANYSQRILGGTAKVTRFNLAAGDVATLKMFRLAVARLRSMGVPTVNGNYVAHIDATTEQQLYSDADFKQALTGRIDSVVYRDLSIGTFVGIDWVRNIEAPTTTDGGAGANLLIHRPIVVGAGALIAAPFANMGSLLQDVEGPHGAVEMISPADNISVAHIIRPPQDKLQQIVSSSWSWVGDFAVPTDVTALGGTDPALFKRGVVLEHTDS